MKTKWQELIASHEEDFVETFETQKEERETEENERETEEGERKAVEDESEIE